MPDLATVLTADPEARLDDLLCPVDRVCSLPLWLEEHTHRLPCDDEVAQWVTVGDVVRWVGV